MVQLDPHQEQGFLRVFHIVGRASDIIEAAGLPPGKVSTFITMRISAAICHRVRPSQADIDTARRSPPPVDNLPYPSKER